jgi:hypothetical protein
MRCPVQVFETNSQFGEPNKRPQQKGLAFPSVLTVITFFCSLGRVVERRQIDGDRKALNSARTNQRLVRPLLAELDRNHSSVLETAPPLSVVGSSFLFSVLQSVCTAVVALNSVRLRLGSDLWR